jgi:hypothetical protein
MESVATQVRLIDCGRASQRTRGILAAVFTELNIPPYNRICSDPRSSGDEAHFFAISLVSCGSNEHQFACVLLLEKILLRPSDRR